MGTEQEHGAVLIEPLENFVPPNVPRSEQERRERCTAALNHWRAAWRLLEDAGVAEQFKDRMTSIGIEIKAAMGGKESDGFDNV